MIALNSVTPAGSAYLGGTTVWYRGVETGGGSFRLRNTVTDNVGGSGAGGSRTNALGGTTTGWTHTASTVATPAGGPYDSNTFTWTQNTTSSPTEVVDALDLATNSLALSTLTFSDDSSTDAPTVTFPVDTSAYNTAGWNAGCSTGPATSAAPRRQLEVGNRRGGRLGPPRERGTTGTAHPSGAAPRSGTPRRDDELEPRLRGLELPRRRHLRLPRPGDRQRGQHRDRDVRDHDRHRAPPRPPRSRPPPRRPRTTTTRGSPAPPRPARPSTSMRPRTAPAAPSPPARPQPSAAPASTRPTSPTTPPPPTPQRRPTRPATSPAAPRRSPTSRTRPRRARRPRSGRLRPPRRTTTTRGSPAPPRPAPPSTSTQRTTAPAAPWPPAPRRPSAARASTPRRRRQLQHLLHRARHRRGRQPVRAARARSPTSRTRRTRRRRSPSRPRAVCTRRHVERPGRHRVRRGRRRAADRSRSRSSAPPTTRYWNGTAFADGTENWRTATGTASWSLAFPASNFPADGDYVFRVRALDNASNTEAASSYTVTIEQRHRPTGYVDHGAAGRPDERDRRVVLLHLDRGRLDVECRLDGGLVVLLLAEELQRPRTGRTPSTCAHRRGRQPGRQPRQLHLDRRHGGAEHHDHRAAERRRARPTPTFSFTASEGGSTFECQLDGGAWTACASPESYTGLTDGSHTFEVRAIDAGATPTRPPPRTWTVDTPRRTRRSPGQPSDPTNDTGSSFGFTSSEGGSTFECRLDGGAWTSCSSPEDYTGLADGPHTFEVRATDASSNVDPTPARFTWTIDTAAPEHHDHRAAERPDERDRRLVLVQRPPRAARRSSAGSTAAAWARLHLAEDLLRPERRLAHLRGACHRRRRQHRRDPASFTWTIDTRRARHVHRLGAAGRRRPRTGATFAFSVDRGRLDLRVPARRRLVGGLLLRRDRSAAWPTAPHLRRARDRRRGQHRCQPRQLHLDDRHRGAEHDDHREPERPVNSASATFSSLETRAGRPSSAGIDGGAWGACSSPKTYTGLAEGSHTFESRAIDAAGNMDLTPAARPGRSTPHRRTRRSPPADRPEQLGQRATSRSRPARAAPRSTVARLRHLGLVRFAEDAQRWDGSHTFEVRASDAVGNADPTPDSFTWTIDTAAPSSSTSFPVNIGSYNIVGWNAGCSPSGSCGTAFDAGSGLDRVEVSIQRSSDSLYWNGSSFASASEDWQNVGGASWNLGFAAAAFPGGRQLHDPRPRPRSRRQRRGAR